MFVNTPVHAERVGLGQVVDAGVEERAEQRDARRDELQVARPCRRAGSTRTAVSWPSASAASSMSWIWPRPWMVASAFSVRSSIQRTGHAVLAGERDAEQLLGVDVELRAEAAADRRGDDAHLVLGDAERERHHDLEDVGDLRGRVEREVAAERLGHGARRRAAPSPSG